MKGRKICPSCNASVGCRCYNCTECQYCFLEKKTQSVIKKHKNGAAKKVVDWKELTAGDIIKVKGGPYMMIGDDKKVKCYIGYRGTFRVKSMSFDGIHVYPVKAGESGHCFIYMGEEKVAQSGTIMRAHSIRKK